MSIEALLLPYQVRWSQDTTALKVWRKSRRIGASYGTAADKVLHAAARHGGNVYYISYDKEMTAGFVADCATWAAALHQAAGQIGEEVLARDDGRDIHSFKIAFPSGHEIKTFSNNPRNLRSKGRPGDILVIDEAAFVDDLEGLLKAAMAMTMWGGRIEVISTDNGADNPYADLIEDIKKGRYGTRASLHFTPIDKALDEGLYRKICAVSGRPWSQGDQDSWLAGLEQLYRHNKDEELYGIPAAGGGTYLPRSLVEANMPPPADSGPLLRFDGSAAYNNAPEPQRRADMEDWLRTTIQPVLGQLDRERRHCAGRDFARSGDMSDLVITEIGADTRKTWCLVLEMHNVPFAQQQQAVFYVIDRLPRFSRACFDARGNGAAESEAARDRYGSARVELVNFTEQIYRDQFPLYKAELEDRTTTLVRHDDILEDHRAVQLVRGVPRVPDKKTDAKGQRHGDSAIAGLLANMAASADPVDITHIAHGGAREPIQLGLTDTPAANRTGFGGIASGAPGWD